MMTYREVAACMASVTCWTLLAIIVIGQHPIAVLVAGVVTPYLIALLLERYDRMATTDD